MHAVIGEAIERLDPQQREALSLVTAGELSYREAAKVEGTTLAAPVYARLVLKDNESGKVVKRQKIMLAEVPTVTQRYSHIIKGKEFQVDNQWQLKPGVYTRRTQKGQLESQLNVSGKQAFKVGFDPASKQFNMMRGSSDAKIPLYPIMKAMGVSEDDLKSVRLGQKQEVDESR